VALAQGTVKPFIGNVSYGHGAPCRKISVLHKQMTKKNIKSAKKKKSFNLLKRRLNLPKGR
jgi:hypothetical protein